ncbi:ERF family protein [Phascolarctobacterium sp.]|uniref:ERF family protein n=1 Tax=Phascolarctobacterium sp. TaxID=2049039 RepID=UPI0038703049
MEKATMNIYQKLQKMRVALQKRELKKSGYNDHKKFSYFELSDFLPHINEIQEEYNTLSLFEIGKECASLTIVDCDNTELTLAFDIPIAELQIQGANTIQNIGGLTTYCRRYLYMIAFEIAENDEFDHNSNYEQPPQPEELYVDEIKIKVLKDKMAKKGVTDNTILDLCQISTFEEMTVSQFVRVNNKLDITPDKESKQVDLGL